nr:DUF3592 domain-containing protein [Bernardetia sp.]
MGLLFTFIGIVGIGAEIRQYNNYTHTQGRVIGDTLLYYENSSSSDFDDAMVHAVVSYETKEGQEVTFIERQGENGESSFEKGEQVKVLYDHTRPNFLRKHSRLYSFTTFWKGGIFGVFGILFILIGIALGFLKRGKSKSSY